MPAPALSAEQLVLWNDTTARRWERLLTANPQALAIGCDVYGVTDVAGLVKHINVVELRYAQRISGIPETSFDEVNKDDLAESYGAHEQALALFRERLADPGYDWERLLEFNTLTLGRMRSTMQGIFIHAMLHSIRHYAQLATLVRQNGIKPDWPMDYLPMVAERLGPNAS